MGKTVQWVGVTLSAVALTAGNVVLSHPTFEEGKDLVYIERFLGCT